MPPQLIKCKVCGRELSPEHFGVGKFGRHKTCNDCVNEKHRATLANKKESNDLKKQLEEARTLRLKDFQPRELIEELKRRGYTGKLTYVQVHEIDLEKF